MAAVLLAVSGRYGYHRDELYFLAAGRHLAWGYPDQPPLTPAVARLMSSIAADSVVVLRLPAVLASAAVVLLTGAIARELGAGRTGQLLAAGAVAISGVFLGAGHLMGTTVFDLLAWAALSLLILRALRVRARRGWLWVGLVAGAGLMDSSLVAFFLAAVGLGLLLVGPRWPLRSVWFWAAMVLAVLIWLPYLIWQARHGWPQLAESRAIAAGQSGTSNPRWQLVPMQLLLVGPWLVPIWIAGLVAVWRRPALRWARAFTVAYAALLAVFTVSGGKGYYAAGIYPVFLAAGAEPTLRWAADHRLGGPAVGAAYVLMLPALVIALPVLPLRTFAGSPLVGANYDTGEQVAWPAYVREVAAAYHRIDATGVAIVTSNYGEAGAIDHYGGAVGLPHAYSGQTGYWYWGPPPTSTTTVLAVGFRQATLATRFRTVTLVGRLNNGVGLDDDEQHRSLWLCRGPRAAWPTLWRSFKTT
jgi:4-amino-4-deoxy-L-arabinose transferase-like glycosyltransferase